MSEPAAKKAKTSERKLNAVLCGSGEYTTGYVHSGGSKSDKKVGVIGLCFFELRRLGKVDSIAIAGTNGTKFPGIRKHLKDNISDVYGGLDTTIVSYPADDVGRDAVAYKAALDTLSPGDVTTIFTPDDTHFEIAKYAIEKGIHVLVTKPPVMTVKDQLELVALAKAKNVFVMVEYHKRWDPIYRDARNRASTKLGDFAFFQSFMSQPKFQLETFRYWAGKSSDISYYLNSHHIDIHCWSMDGKGKPLKVTASGATGVAHSDEFKCPKGTEDTITLLTEWENTASGNRGTALYTASWSAPKADVHSQQRFHYMGTGGEMTVDQAHRNYHVCTHEDGYNAINPLYMYYLPSAEGNFDGHHGYGYKSIESFLKGAEAINNGTSTLDELDAVLPTLKATLVTTAILEAGRRSLDAGGASIAIEHDAAGNIKDFSEGVPKVTRFA